MNTIEGLTIRWQPWNISAALSHILQSSIVGLIILMLMFAARRASARTRWVMGWIALLKFALPLIWFNSTVSRLDPSSIVHWTFSPSGVIAQTPQNLHLPVTAAAGGLTLGDVAFCVWLAGAILLIGRWLLRGRRLRSSLLKSAEPFPTSLMARVERAAVRVGLAVAPRCVAIGEAPGPGIVGIFSTILVLPRSLEGSLSVGEIDAILIHELTHIRRRDALLTGLQAIVVRVFWFDPVVWLLNRSLHIETEKSCDEAVLDITGNAKVYAGGILKVVRQSLGLRGPGFAGATGVPIVERVKNILARSAAPHRQRPMVPAICAAAGVFALSGFSGAIRVNSVPAALMGRALVIREFDSSKGAPNFEPELDGLGYSSATIKAAEMSTTDLSQYSLIVLPGTKRQTEFYADYAKAADRFDQFVQHGGTLLLEVNGPEAEGFLRQSFHAIPDQPDGGAPRVP
jgi:beta-lactamase regulating signal transducer with metallopeptidase domain